MFGFRQLFSSGNYGTYDGLDRGLKNNRISQKYWEPLDVSCLFFPTNKQRNICLPKELENKTYNDFVGHIMVESQMQRMPGIMKRNVLTRRKKTKHGFFFMPSTRSILQKRKLRENVINNIIHACTSWNRWTIIKSIAEAILFISFPEIFMYHREVLSFYGLNQNASYMLVDKNIVFTRR